MKITDYNHESWCDIQNNISNSCNCIVGYPLEAIEELQSKLSEAEKKLEIAINALKAIDCSNDDMKYFNSEINNIVRSTLLKIKADK